MENLQEAVAKHLVVKKHTRGGNLTKKGSQDLMVLVAAEIGKPPMASALEEAVQGRLEQLEQLSREAENAPQPTVTEVVGEALRHIEYTYEDGLWVHRDTFEVTPQSWVVDALKEYCWSYVHDKYPEGKVTTGLNRYIAHHRTGKLFQLRAKLIDPDPNLELAKQRCREYAASMGGPEDRRELETAVLLHFYQNIKRKMMNMIVKNHLALSLLGPGGIGKSWLLNEHKELFGDRYNNSTMEAVHDSREIEKYTNGTYLVGIEEPNEGGDWKMAATVKNALKRIITEDTSTSRIMGTRGQDRLRVTASFFMTTNRSVRFYAGDSVTMRRFYEFNCEPPENDTVIARFVDSKWLAETIAAIPLEGEMLGPDATPELWAQLHDIQETYKPKSHIEVWYEFDQDGADGTRVDLAYADYEKWMRVYMPNKRPKDLDRWVEDTTLRKLYDVVDGVLKSKSQAPPDDSGTDDDGDMNSTKAPSYSFD